MKLWLGMLHMCVFMHSRVIENHLIRILEDGPLISEVVLSQLMTSQKVTTYEDYPHEVYKWLTWTSVECV